MIGETLGHYRIEALLGVGGMGEVYRAHDRKLERDVALKVLPPEMAADPERRRRFEREARAIAALQHPNIVVIHTVEEAEGRNFLTMELIEGNSLGELIPPDGFGTEELLRIAVDLAEALTVAHDRGITHRDLKPANVMLDTAGRLKVLDFGLAKLREPLESALNQTRTLPVDEATADGRILGTIAYMSPEQAEGKPVDARSDVFSLGVMLYEMATGERPFKGDTDISTLSSILRDEPRPITDIKQRLPRHLGRIVKRCLAKDPDRRYQTAHDLRNDLLALKDEIDSGELDVDELAVNPPASTDRRSRLWLILAAVPVLAAGAYVLRPFLRERQPVEGQPAQTMQVTRLTTTGNAYEAAMSPDGRYVAYVVRERGLESIRIAQVATGSEVEIVPTADAHLTGVAFSTTGDHVFYVTTLPNQDGGDLMTVPALGGTPRRVAGSAAAGAAFSPDGARLAFIRVSGDTTMVVVSRLDGKGERVLKTSIFPTLLEDRPAWSPDGKTLVVAELSIQDMWTYRLLAIDVALGAAEPLTLEPWIGVAGLAWLPDGSGLIAAGSRTMREQGDQLWEVSYPGGGCTRITNDTNNYSGVRISTDGSVLSASVVVRDFDVYVTTAEDPSGLEALTAGNQVYNGSGLSWAGNDTIVYGAAAATGAVEGPQYGMYLHRVVPRTKSIVRLVDFWSAYPRARAGIPEIVFAAIDSTGIHVWKMATAGGEPVQLTFGLFETTPDLSPDGEQVVYFGGSGWEIFRIPRSGGEPVPVGGVTGYTPLFSPDGTRIAYSFRNPETENWEFYIIPAEGPVDTLARVHLPASEFEWAPDGNALTYVCDRDGFDNIWSQPLAGGDPAQLTFFTGPERIEFHAWSPDGSRLALTRGVRTSDVVLIRNFR